MPRYPEHVHWQERPEPARGVVPVRVPAVPPPGEPAAKAESFGQRLALVLGGITGAWTVVGGLCYAVLWDAHRHFFDAFGLTPQEVGYSRESLLVRAAVSGLILLAAFGGPMVLGLAGAWLVWDWTHHDDITRTALVLTAVGAAAGGVWSVITVPTSFVLFIASYLTYFFALGVLIGAVSLPGPGGAETPAGLRRLLRKAVVLTAATIVVVNVLLDSLFLFVVSVHPAVALVSIVAVNVSLAYLMARARPGRFRLSVAGRPAFRAALRRRRPHITAVSTVALVIALSMAVPWALTWSNDRFGEGQLAVERGYYQPGGIVSYSVRPVFVYLVDENKDPARVCGDSAHAASLIAAEGNGWWVLLRPAGQRKPAWARVVWLPRDKYLMDLSPLAHLPRPEPSDGATAGGAAVAEPFSWQAAACG